MGNIFFIIIITIVIGLFGGLIYLIYLPFKKRLIKSSKLSDKLSRQINLTFILSLCFVGIVLYHFKDYRTPSKYRLEKISDIKLPTNFTVLRDEYQDMWQDCCIIYDIQLGNNATSELIENIKKSEFYNPNSFHNEAWKESDFITVDSVKAVWSKSPNGFNFYREVGRTLYHIKFDTVTNILKYNECAD